ncbi:hypothetical protein [Paraburkholderia sp. JHI869]|uniref:hypothetical protein n=1 Tax=Paraburkholderia sp. JHI869 TaxID=3112959 RepID=UPI003175D58A
MSTSEQEPRRNSIAPPAKAIQVRGNPLLASIRGIPTLPEAMELTTVTPPDASKDRSKQELIAAGAADTLVSNATIGRVLTKVITFVRDSYHDRDLRNPHYRDYAANAASFLHRKRNTSGHVLPSRFGIAPRAKPRGMIVAVPVRMGRRLLAQAIHSAIGSQALAVRVPESNGFTDYLQLPCLRLLWPIDGKLGSFAQGFFGAFDAAMQTEYALNTRSPLFRERDIVPSMCALSVAANLGVLIVERINTEDASANAASATWNAIGQFTRTTGIPVLCLSTPGAAVLGPGRLPGVLGDLTATAPIELLPPPSSRDIRWIAICRALFDRTLRIAGIESMPFWLPSVAYQLTAGYPGLLAIVLKSIALSLAALKAPTLSREVFITYGMQALRLHAPHIDAVKSIRRKKIITPPTLVRYSDWLSIAKLGAVFSVPELLIPSDDAEDVPG